MKWKYGIWKEWLPDYKGKIWHYDDGCYKVMKEINKEKHPPNHPYRLTIGWHLIGHFKKSSTAKKVAELIHNG